MLKPIVLYTMLGLLLIACQSQLPVASDQQACPDPIESVELTNIDYLLFANRMVDKMIQDSNVQREIANKRMNLTLIPVANNSNDAIDLASVNLTIKNRLLRSGQFILNGKNTGTYQLSGAFDKKTQASTGCESYSQFSLQLLNRETNRILWSDNTKFNE